MKMIKEYWAIIVVLGGAIVTGVTWIAIIDSKTFDSPEQKVEHIHHIKNVPSPKQEMMAYILDSINNTQAIQSRKLRDSTFKAQDSVRKVFDSVMLDYVQRNADQIYQIKEEIKKNNN